MAEEEKKHLFTDFPDITTSTWEEKIVADLKGADYQRRLVWKSDEGIHVKPYYRKEDTDLLEYLEGIGNLKQPSDNGRYRGRSRSSILRHPAWRRVH